MILYDLIRKAFYNEINEEEIIECLKSMNASGKEVDKCRHVGDTLLCYACDNDMVSLAKYLVDIGCNINIQGKDNWTPLMCAVKNKSTEISSYLISHGAEINKENVGTMTELMLASHYGRLDNVRLLISHGADIFKKDFLGSTPCDHALEKTFAGIYDNESEYDEIIYILKDLMECTIEDVRCLEIPTEEEQMKAVLKLKARL